MSGGRSFLALGAYWAVLRAISETQGYFNKVKSDLAADQGGATGAMQK